MTQARETTSKQKLVNLLNRSYNIRHTQRQSAIIKSQNRTKSPGCQGVEFDNSD